MADDQVFVQRRFIIDQDGSRFSDAIVLPIDEYNALAEKEIDALKQERVDGWKKAIEDAQNAPLPTEEEELAALDAAIAAAQDEVLRLQDTKAEKQAEAATVDADPTPVVLRP